MATRKYHQTNWAWVMHATKTLSSNAPHLGDKFQTKHAHYADTQNVQTTIVHHGMCGVIYETQLQHTQHGKMQPMHVAAPKGYDKQKNRQLLAIFIFMVDEIGLEPTTSSM